MTLFHSLLHVVVTHVHLLPPQHLQGHVGRRGGREAALERDLGSAGPVGGSHVCYLHKQTQQTRVLLVLSDYCSGLLIHPEDWTDPYQFWGGGVAEGTVSRPPQTEKHSGVTSVFHRENKNSCFLNGVWFSSVKYVLTTGGRQGGPEGCAGGGCLDTSGLLRGLKRRAGRPGLACRQGRRSRRHLNPEHQSEAGTECCVKCSSQ